MLGNSVANIIIGVSTQLAELVVAVFLVYVVMQPGLVL